MSAPAMWAAPGQEDARGGAAGGLSDGWWSPLRHPRRWLAVATLVAVAAGTLASRLTLRTAIEELLPSGDPAVVTLRHTQARVGDMNLLTIGIRSPDRAANLAYAAKLTAALQALPPTQVGLAAYHLRDLTAFFQHNRWLYASVEDLETVTARLRQEIGRRKNPLFVSLDDDGDARAADQALRQRLEHTPLDQQFPDGYFVRGDVAWVLVLPVGGMFGEHAGEALVNAVEGFVAAHPPSAFHPAMRVQPLGPVMVGLENRRAVESEIISVTAVCTLIVALSIAAYFRRLRSVPLVVLPAALGTAIAFAAGALGFGYLNGSTAFLGSIILGNGINHAIVLLARVQEEMRARAASDATARRAAIVAAVAATARATLTAALAASAAYLSLTLTSFRGFSQFGVMAAVGSLACWASAYTVLPAWLSMRARRGHAAPPPAPLSLGPLAALVARRPLVVVLGAAGLTVAALAALPHFARAPFEYDFRKLRADVARTPERRQLDDNLNQMLGRWHTPTVVLADSVAQVPQIPDAIRRADSATHPVIGRVVTVYDVLPGTPDVQRRKLELLAGIRRLTRDPSLGALPDADRARLEQLTPPDDLRVMTPQDLPPLARRPFTETDGTVGRVVLAYHAAETVSMWDGHDLMAIAHVLQRLTLADGSVIDTSGSPMVFGAMLRSVLRDGPRATLLSWLAVAALIAALLRPRRAAVVALATLALGVLWMVGAAGLLHVRITFLNFIALPITFGIGGEYALNIVARWQKEGSASAAVRSTGGAVLLCSWTTIAGYGSLLAAHSQALRGFGAMAILGEAACLLAALVAVPAWLVWRQRPKVA